MRVDGLIFDFGNTLFPWSEEQSLRLFEGLEPVFREACGPMENFAAEAKRQSNAMQRERDATDFREPTVRCLVERMCPDHADDELVDRVTARLHETFVSLCRMPDGLRATLEELGRDRPLALLSNYLLTESVEEVLERDEVRDCFEHVEVSATRGFRKPHPEPFEAVREALGTPMERTMMVGDTFFADIVGGHRAGLLTALTQQYAQGPTSDPRAPEVKPDLVIQHLSELPR